MDELYRYSNRQKYNLNYCLIRNLSTFYDDSIMRWEIIHNFVTYYQNHQLSRHILRFELWCVKLRVTSEWKLVIQPVRFSLNFELISGSFFFVFYFGGTIQIMFYKNMFLHEFGCKLFKNKNIIEKKWPMKSKSMLKIT